MGASSGIGLALAEALASRGVRIGVAARHTETLKALAASYPGMLEVMSIDVTRRDAVERLSELAGRIGGMDVYIHVAGIGFDNSTLEPEREVDIVRTNAVGFARMVSAAYRYFRVNGVKGQIAAVTSVAGTRGIDRLAASSTRLIWRPCVSSPTPTVPASPSPTSGRDGSGRRCSAARQPIRWRWRPTG